ncbi:hypothetical protein QPK87_33360 [Kamptonema cortianum]|jgi:hypothetical protein|nr:hypothetical protein [Geitlerinema splendidum]MDK3161406.1 hypothetical protein [Kamptonema cortianum]
MKNYSKKLYLIIVCSLFCWEPAFGMAETTEELIDAHSSTPAKIKSHISEIYNYTIQCVQGTNDPRFTRALAFLENQSGEYSDNFGDNVILGALSWLQQVTQKEKPINQDIIEAAEAASLLLSPDLFNQDFQYPSKYVMYDTIISKRNLYYVLGMNRQNKLPKEQSEKILEIFPRNFSENYALISRYFTPMVLRGDKAIFSEEAYLYALSKGIILYGLTDDLTLAHGGIYERPIELFIHDQGHHNEILDPDPEVEASENTYSRLSHVVQQMATQFYTLIKHSGIFEEAEKKKAFRAGFNLLHEHEIFSIRTQLTQIFITHQELLGILKDRFIDRTLSRFPVDNKMKPPSLMSPGEKALRSLYPDLAQRDEFFFNERFYSDLATGIVEIYPEAESQIFGTETDLDRNIWYDFQSTRKWNGILIEWFHDKIKDHIH